MLSRGTRPTVPEQTGPRRPTDTHTGRQLPETEELKKKRARLVSRTVIVQWLPVLVKDLRISDTHLNKQNTLVSAQCIEYIHWLALFCHED